MGSDDQKKQNPLVDEEHLMSIIAEGVRKPAKIESQKETPTEAINMQDSSEEKPVIREKGRGKKLADVTYGERFLNTHSMTKRGEKSIYIRSEYHERLSRIVQVIGDDKIPLYAYLDNILEHHFEIFEKAITDDYNNKLRPIF